jgi:TPR repeat protein
MKSLILAAEQGDAGAQFNLAVLYDNRLDDNERPTAGNHAQAMKWLMHAAEQGLPRAQVRLAEMYADRPETPADFIAACTWLLMATENLSGIHRQRAQLDFARISSRMTSAQIVRARRLARDWKPKRQSGIAAVNSKETP